MQSSEEKNLETTNESLSENTTKILTGWISVGVFKYMKQKFEARVSGGLPALERTPLYLSRKVLEEVLKASKGENIAFVYILNAENGPISIAVMGTDMNKRLVFENAHASSFYPGSTIPISKEEIEAGMKKYAARMGGTLDPKRDEGVTHEKIPFKEWLDGVSEDAKLYFGVDKDEFQNIMFVTDQPRDIETMNDDDDYALDVGNMCCPS